MVGEISDRVLPGLEAWGLLAPRVGVRRQATPNPGLRPSGLEPPGCSANCAARVSRS